MFAKWKPLNYQTKPILFNLGDLLNTSDIFEITDSELTDCLNVDSRAYPALKVRNKRTTYSTITTPKMLGQRNNQYLLAVDGTTLKYYNFTTSLWTDLVTGLTGTGGKAVDFSTGTTRYTIFSNGTERKAWDGTVVTDLTNMPQSDKFTVHDGRVYVLRSNDINFSGLNKVNDYTTINDAGTIDITRAIGDGMAITTYKSQVIAWTLHSMHKLVGTGPLTYDLKEVDNQAGCVSDRSVIEIDGVLYWLGLNGVYAYEGGLNPVLISDEKVHDFLARMTVNYQKATSGTDGKYLYLAISIDGATDNNIILTYDTKRHKWSIEDGNLVDFAELGGNIWGLFSNGKIKDMEAGYGGMDDGVNISWYAITKPFTEKALKGKKFWHRLNILFDLPTGSTFQVDLSNYPRGDNWTTIKTLTASSDIQNQKIEIPLNVARNTDCIRIKLSGTGPCTIYELERQLRVRK